MGQRQLLDCSSFELRKTGKLSTGAEICRDTGKKPSNESSTTQELIPLTLMSNSPHIFDSENKEIWRTLLNTPGTSNVGDLIIIPYQRKRIINVTVVHFFIWIKRD